MNRYQALWWQQARSDHDVLVLLRRQGAVACHQLHYLQMVTEKLGKAYFWRSAEPPRRSHAVFVQFMRAMGSVPQSDRSQVAEVFGFARFQDLRNWIRAILPLAYELQNLAPALADDGPNPEYPWPPSHPEFAPATYEFPLWNQLVNTSRGRQLLQIVRLAVERFPHIA